MGSNVFHKNKSSVMMLFAEFSFPPIIDFQTISPFEHKGDLSKVFEKLFGLFAEKLKFSMYVHTQIIKTLCHEFKITGLKDFLPYMPSWLFDPVNICELLFPVRWRFH